MGRNKRKVDVAIVCRPSTKTLSHRMFDRLGSSACFSFQFRICTFQGHLHSRRITLNNVKEILSHASPTKIAGSATIRRELTAHSHTTQHHLCRSVLYID